MKNTRKIVFISLLVAQAMVLFVVESMIPVPSIAPGAKLGLANIVTVVALYYFNFGETLLIVLLRILLATFIGGSVSTLLYSLAGGLLSLIAMYTIKKAGGRNISTIGISVTGSVFHNIGQVITAAAIVQNIALVSYLPVLLFIGTGTGIFVGFTSKYMLYHLDKLNIIKRTN